MKTSPQKRKHKIKTVVEAMKSFLTHTPQEKLNIILKKEYRTPEGQQKMLQEIESLNPVGKYMLSKQLNAQLTQVISVPLQHEWEFLLIQDFTQLTREEIEEVFNQGDTAPASINTRLEEKRKEVLEHDLDATTIDEELGSMFDMLEQLAETTPCNCAKCTAKRETLN